MFSSWTPQFRRNHGMDRRNDPCHSSKGSDFGTARNSRCLRHVLGALQGATPLARLHRQRACRSRNLPSHRTWVSAPNTSDIYLPTIPHQKVRGLVPYRAKFPPNGWLKRPAGLGHSSQLSYRSQSQLALNVFLSKLGP